MSMFLKSSVFKDGEWIPEKFTCDGDNINPLIEIHHPPHGTKSFVLIMDDPDATRGYAWDHWVLWNIDSKTQYIMEDTMPGGAECGINSFGKKVYGGPCPPRGGKPHHYVFTLFALDTVLELGADALRCDVESAMQGHILETAKLIAMYGRKEL